jgi:hypothetical protein
MSSANHCSVRRRNDGWSMPVISHPDELDLRPEEAT